MVVTPGPPNYGSCRPPPAVMWLNFGHMATYLCLWLLGHFYLPNHHPHLSHFGCPALTGLVISASLATPFCPFLPATVDKTHWAWLFSSGLLSVPGLFFEFVLAPCPNSVWASHRNGRASKRRAARPVELECKAAKQEEKWGKTGWWG